MSTSVYDKLFDLRGQLEAPIAAGLSDVTEAYTRLNSAVFQKERARLELTIRVGQPLGHKKMLSPTDRRHDMWAFSMAVRVISPTAANITRNEGESDADFTERQKQNGNLHAQLVSRITSYLSAIQLESKDDLVNWPVVTLLLLTGPAPDPTLKSQDGYEMTSLNYNGQFGIRPSAWNI